MRLIKLLIILALILQSCGGSDDGAGPGPAPLELGDFQLSFPNNNEVCTEGTNISGDLVEIPFRWSPSKNATSYRIEATGTQDGTVYQTTSTTNSGAITLPKGTQFTWKVIANLKDDTKESDTTWNFYSEGVTTLNHIPFPAEITLEDNKDGTINILWEGNDLDNDIDKYEVYLSNDTTRTLIADTQETSITNYQIMYDVIYNLEVITKDQRGNSSSSKRDFRFKN